MKQNKQLKDLEKIKKDQDVQFSSMDQQTPLDQLTQQLAGIEQDIRKQQLGTETTLQSTFSQAASGLSDTQSLAQLMQNISNLGNLVKNQGLQGSAAQYTDLFSQLSNDLHKQIKSESQQVVNSLQHAVTALAQANSVLLDSETYHQALHSVHQCQLMLANWQSQGNTPPH